MYSKISVIISVILVTAAILTVQSSMLQPSYAQLDTASQTAILNLHNQERRAVGVPDVTWSNSLATDAENWARYLARLGLRPITNTSPGDIPPHSEFSTNGGQGENLSWGTKGAFTPIILAQGWANERANYTPGTPISSSLSGPNGVYGHYTQMVWSSTTQIGCGMFSDANQDYLVCRYLPAGNYIGQAPYG